MPEFPMLLTSARLVLRDLAVGDLDFVAEMLADPGVMRYYPKPLTRIEAQGWIERQRARYARDGHGLWLVSDQASGHPLGQVGLLRQDLAAARTGRLVICSTRATGIRATRRKPGSRSATTPFAFSPRPA